MKKSMMFEGVAVTLLILLSFLTLAMLLGSEAKPASSIGDIQYTYAGDDTLYVFTGSNISAIAGNGSLLWTFNVPGQWSVCDYGFFYPNPSAPGGAPSIYAGDPIVTTSDGILYVYMRPAHPGPASYLLGGALMAISGGKELWELPLTSHNASVEYLPYYSYHLSDASISADGRRVYAFHDYNETVIDENGTILWSLGNVAAPAAVDERGFVYVTHAPAPSNGSLKYPYSVYVPDYREPSNVVKAYYPNGTLYWILPVVSPLVFQYDQRTLTYASATLPIYNNGTVYAPMYDGISAIDPNGTIRWTKTYDWDDFKFDWPFDVNNLTGEQKSGIAITERMYANYDPSPRLERYGITIGLRLYAPMPFDSRGNIYLQSKTEMPMKENSFVIALGPDGHEISRVNITEYAYVAAKDGIGYASTGNGFIGFPGSGNLLRAIDVKSGRELWNYTFTATDTTTVTLDRDNVRALLDPNLAEEALAGSPANFTGREHYAHGPYESNGLLYVYPFNNTIYVSFQSLSYEKPIVLGKSKCTYASEVYALDENGTLLWQRPITPFAAMQVTQNGTVFYQTPDGRVGATSAGIAAGFTLTALLYLFLRFLCLGAVARAKARLGKNEKRNRILDFIARNPGSSLYEVTRGTGVNLGTVRYHLFILGMNRKITASQTDGKYVRYFASSGTYSKEEQLILSLMRRDVMGKVLSLMLKRPGISNAEMARELDLQESVVCRCTKELSVRGIITKEPAGRGCSIEEAHREHVVTAMRRIHG